MQLCTVKRSKYNHLIFALRKKRRTVSSWTRIYLPYIAVLVNSGQILSVEVF